MELVDDLFYVWQQRWGTWTTADREGKHLITSLTRDIAVSATHFYLKGRQEGWDTPDIAHSGTVDGKL